MSIKAVEEFNYQQSLACLLKHSVYILSNAPCSITRVANHFVAEGDISSYEAALDGIMTVKNQHPHTLILEKEGKLGYFLVFLHRQQLSEITALKITEPMIKVNLQDQSSLKLSKFQKSRQRRRKKKQTETACPTVSSVPILPPNTIPTTVTDPSKSTAKGISTSLEAHRELACDILGKQSSQVATSLSWIMKMLDEPTCLQAATRQLFVEKQLPNKPLMFVCESDSWAKCVESGNSDQCAGMVHFERLIEGYTDPSLGDCAYLDSCFKGKQCKFVHYRIRYPSAKDRDIPEDKNTLTKISAVKPAQYINADILKLNLKRLGSGYKALIIDPPWDIHTNPFSTVGCSDDDIQNLDISSLQSNGVCFLWVTGRVLELGRNCLVKWGYNHIEEMIWLKTNQLGKTICTGRTGHWLNHTKEHVLVGLKGDSATKGLQLDTDVLLSNALGKSQKPEELYDIIDRIVGPEAKKLELFGRSSNIRPGWVTVGNELRNTKVMDPELKFNLNIL